MTADLTIAALPIDVRERARVIAAELLRRRGKGFPAFHYVGQLGAIMQRYIENRSLHIDEIMAFARALAGDEEEAA